MYLNYHIAGNFGEHISMWQRHLHLRQGFTVCATEPAHDSEGNGGLMHDVTQVFKVYYMMIVATPISLAL